MTQKSSDSAISTGTSRRTTGLCTASAVIVPVTPTTSRMFAMLDPITLPTARPGLPERLASRVTASSGADVANETTVRPTTSGESPSAPATVLAPRTRSSPPATSSTRPASSSAAVIGPPVSGAGRGSGRQGIGSAGGSRSGAAANEASVARGQPLGWSRRSLMVASPGRSRQCTTASTTVSGWIHRDGS